MSKIIKCMFFVLLAAVLPLSVHAQQVTLHLQDVTVRKAFRELEVKGNVSLVYEKNDVDLTRKVTVKVDNQPISKALDQILKGQELIYKIEYFRPEGANKHFLSILISCTNPYGSIKSYSYPAGMSGRVCAYKPVIQLSSP